jgi:GTPase
MPLPRIAIVGKPNAGKSSLINMIAGSKVSIVDPTPGVTRDRVSAVVTLEAPFKDSSPKQVEFIDTGGFGAYYGEGARFDEIGNDLRRLTREIEGQIAKAVSDADLILFAIDVHAGITPADEQIARMLREQKLGRRDRASGHLVPVQVVATKVDGPSWEAHAHELAALGFGQPLMCSAKNNYMRRDLLDALHTLTPDIPGAHRDPSPDVKVAIIGKRNAGKSTLVNALAGEERVIVSEIPGTTRDAIDVRIEVDGRAVVVVDTAGLRRKKSFQGQVEWYAFDRLQRALDRADVAMLLIDATTKLSQVDEQLAMLCQKSHKPVVVVVNKWDIAEGAPGRRGRPVTAEDYEQYLRRELGGLPYAPVSFMSGLTGLNIRPTLDLAFELADQSRERVSTGRLNRVMRRVVELRSPPNKLGTHAKVFYVAQTGVAPPTITMIVSHPELFTPNYQRFLLNRIREITPFQEVPIRLNVRARTRTEQSERGQGSELPADIGLTEAADFFADDMTPAEAPATREPKVKNSKFALIDEDGRELREGDLLNAAGDIDLTDEELDEQLRFMLAGDESEPPQDINEPAGLPDAPIDDGILGEDEEDAEDEAEDDIEDSDESLDEDLGDDTLEDDQAEDLDDDAEVAAPRRGAAPRAAAKSTPKTPAAKSGAKSKKPNRPSKAKREARAKYFDKDRSGGTGKPARTNTKTSTSTAKKTTKKTTRSEGSSTPKNSAPAKGAPRPAKGAPKNDARSKPSATKGKPSKSISKPNSKPSGKPSGKPSAKPTGKPTGKPAGKKPAARTAPNKKRS